jgi:hypothetical protein
MGDAFTAVADDINALIWNPAGLAQLKRPELGVAHAELFAGTRYDFLGFGRPLKSGAAWGTGVQYLSQGRIEARSADRSESGSFAASDLAVNLAYSSPIFSRAKLGANFKYLQSRIADASAQGWAVDLGAMQATPLAGLNFGAAVQNLGPGLKFIEERSSLPLALAAGLAYRLPLGMTLAWDVKHMPRDRRTTVSIGTEYAVFSGLALRAGYLGAAQWRRGTGGQEGMAGLGAGFGLRVRGYGVDYAFTPMGELGHAQRLSLSSHF